VVTLGCIFDSFYETEPNISQCEFWWEKSIKKLKRISLKISSEWNNSKSWRIEESKQRNLTRTEQETTKAKHRIKALLKLERHHFSSGVRLEPFLTSWMDGTTYFWLYPTRISCIWSGMWALDAIVWNRIVICRSDWAARTYRRTECLCWSPPSWQHTFRLVGLYPVVSTTFNILSVKHSRTYQVQKVQSVQTYPIKPTSKVNSIQI